MPALSAIVLFLGAALLLLVIPGPAVLYITTRTLSQGRAAGLVSALGVAIGSTFHVAAATLGLSAVLVSSAAAFTAVKWVGAGYLIWLGVRRIFLRDPAPGEPVPLRRSTAAIFRQGVVVNLTNPKTALFFLAFLPQFVAPSRGAVWPQILFFGLLFTLLGLATDSLWALAADRVGGWLRRSPRVRSRGRIVSGGVYIGLGLASAFAGTRKT
jgi:threonine/homoserine/homoserine lactone efflux protein